MADKFGADPQMAGQVSRELAQVRSDMQSLGGVFDGYAGATGSTRVEAALGEFFTESSDNRKKMSELLERGSGLLRGLAEGTTAVDKGLADALQPKDGPAAGPAVRVAER